MATYTPAQLIVPKLMGNGSGNISTWRNQDTSNANVHRTTSFSATGANAVTVQEGATGAATGVQTIIDTYVLAASVPTIFNWWITVAQSSYFQGYANAATVTGQSSGYTVA